MPGVPLAGTGLGAEQAALAELPRHAGRLNAGRAGAHGELVDPVVVGVGHVDVADGIGQHVGRLDELAGPVALVPPDREHAALGGELLNSGVAGVGHIHVARRVHIDSGRAVELP